MFFLPFVTLGLATAAFATPLRRADSLVVDVKAAEASVESIDGIKLVATVKNTGAEDVRILKYGTVLDSLPTRSFKVTKDNTEVDFTGVKIQVSLEDATEETYTVIPAGKEVSVTHDVASLYNFAAAGTGKFSFEPIVDFPVADVSANAKEAASFSRIQPSASAVVVEVTSDVAKREIVAKRAVTTCSSNSSRASFITASYNEAKTLATVAANYISSNSGSSLYTAYWGTNSATTVRSRFTAVANENSSSRTLSCTDTYGVCSGGVIAYTVIATTNIYYCSIFFNEVPNTSLCSGTTVASRNVRGGTTLHELTHALSGTDDVTYGCAADQALSVSNKLRNADNYNCFSTQVYQNTQC